MAKRLDLLHGTLDLLILKALSLGPLHGYGILPRIHQGWIESHWGESENKRKARYYRLTRSGSSALHAETEYWDRMSDAIAAVLRATPEEA